MRFLTRLTSFHCVCLLAVSLLGCSGSNSQDEASTELGVPAVRSGLNGLAEMLRAFKIDGKSPPRTMSDFAPYAPAFPDAEVLLQNGTVVYMYGAQVDPTSPEEKLVAMQADADENGGLVLITTGEVKYLEAAEVAAMPPAGKKSKK